MKLNESVLNRFTELEDEGKLIEFDFGGESAYVEGTGWQKWATSVLNLLQGVFGSGTPHYQNFKNIYDYFRYTESHLAEAKGVFLAAKADYAGGYLFNLESSISGQIFGDFVALAKQALKEGSKDVAAVLACAALEDTLKKYAVINNLDVQNKEMQEVVNALKLKRHVSRAQKTLLDTMPKIRDFAMHANWDKLTPQDVSSVIGYVEQFLLSHFST